jgi:hypothetical protein
MIALRRARKKLGRKTMQAKRQKTAESPELQLQEDHISPPDHGNIDDAPVRSTRLLADIYDRCSFANILGAKKARNGCSIRSRD